MTRQICNVIRYAVALYISSLAMRNGLIAPQVVNADDTGETTTTKDGEEHTCKTVDDVDEVNCKLEDLSLDALRETCTRLGLSVEKQIFPYIFDEGDKEDTELELDPDIKLEDVPIDTERTHADYVKAAIECLSIEEEMEGMVMDENDELQSLFDQEMEHDPDMLSNIMAELLTNDPSLLAQVEAVIKEEDPELYKELLKELSENGEGKEGEGDDESGTMLDSLKARPDLVAEVLTQMIMEDPSLLEDMEDEMFGDYEDEDDEGMDAYFNMNGDDEPDDEDEEDLEALKRHMADVHDEM